MKSTKFPAKIFIVISVFVIILNCSCSQQKMSFSPEQKVEAESAEAKTSNYPQINAAQKIIDKAPNNAAGYNMLASAYIGLARETGDFSLNSKAQTSINRALEVEPEDTNAQKIQASLHLTFHRFDEALEAGKKLQQKYPQDAFVYGVLTDANVEIGNYDEAVESIQRMVDLKPNMESYARVSYVRSLYGDTNGAIEAMNTAARIADPKNKEGRAWCFVHLGNEFYKAGRYQEAELSYDNALKVFPEYHFALAGKGQARMANGDYENAIKFLTQSQNRVPLTQTIIELGDLYKETGNQPKADEQYQLVEVVEQKLGLNNDQRALALFWADHDTKLDEALTISEREHSLRKDIYTADIYAWCLYKKGRFEEAKTVINDAMRLKNKDARIFYHAGMIENSLGNKKEAKQFLQKALQINPAFDVLQTKTAKMTLLSLS